VLRVTIDGTRHVVAGQPSILDAAGSVGVEIPTVCHDPRLAPTGACRVCLVHVDGSDRPVAACTTPATDGMVVVTETPELRRLRADLLRMLAREDAGPPAGSTPVDSAFDLLLHRHGVASDERSRHPRSVDVSHPYIAVDMDRCILCFRCVRICADVQGQFTWRVWGRGAATRILPDSGTTLAESSCVSCGACVDTCPTTALQDRTVRATGPATAWTRTVCPYCGVGCELEVGTRDERIVAARPVLDAPVNKGHLCVKGRYAHAFVHATDRVTSPMIRSRGHWEPVSWGEAIDHVASELRRILDRHGPASVGVLGSARATNEDNYVVQKFARVVLGTNNVDSCARVCHAPSAAALGTMLGTGASTNSFDDIEAARTILVFGANVTENHPVVGARIAQAAMRGAGLVVVDPRAIDLVDHADVYLRVRPGTNVALLNALAAVVLDEGLEDVEYLARHVDGLDELRATVAGSTPEAVAPICGVDPDDIRRAARLYATAKPAMSFHGLGITEHRHGTDMVRCLVNLALLTGNIGKPGTGVNPLRGQNNVQGAAHMGCEPHRLTGFVPLDEGRDRCERVWGSPVPSAPGLDAVQMVDAAARGDLHALWVVGWDVLLTNPDTNRTRPALADLDLVVVQDLFLTETARDVGTVFIPACSTYERDGTFMNAERRVQRVRAVIDPVGDSRPDWDALRLAAGAMGHAADFPYASAADIWEEIRRVWPVGAGIGYERLDREHGLQWPCPHDDHPGTTILHADGFARPGGRARLASVPYRPPADAPSEPYPLVLVTGRNLYAFNAGTMTGRTANVTLRPTDTLEISVDDADRLGVVDGAAVRVTSRSGSIELVAEVTDRVRPGELFATFNDARRRVNRVTGPHGDEHTRTPEYKVTAVRVDAVRTSPTGA